MQNSSGSFSELAADGYGRRPSIHVAEMPGDDRLKHFSSSRRNLQATLTMSPQPLRPSVSFQSPNKVGLSNQSSGLNTPGDQDAELCPERLFAPGTVSASGAFFSITSALLGTGLSVPYGFNEIGTVVGCVAMLFAALLVACGVRMVTLSLCSQKCLKFCEQEELEPRECELSALAHCAYGERGRVFASVVLSLELWFALVVGLVSIGVNGALVTRGHLSQGAFIAISVVVLFPMLDAPPWMLAYGGICSLIGTCLCAASFFDAGYEAWPAISTHEVAPPAQTDWNAFLTLVSASGIFIYGYGNAACLPPIRSEMVDRDKFPLVSALALLASLAFYAGMGLASRPFGTSIGQSYLENVTRPMFLTVACASIMISFLFVMPLMTNPILLALLPVVRIRADSTLQIFVFKVVFSVVSAAAAIFMQDYLAPLSSLTGTSLTFLTIILFPIGIYVKLVPGISRAEKALLVCITIFSVFFVIMGTYVAVLDIVGLRHDAT